MAPPASTGFNARMGPLTRTVGPLPSPALADVPPLLDRSDPGEPKPAGHIALWLVPAGMARVRRLVRMVRGTAVSRGRFVPALGCVEDHGAQVVKAGVEFVDEGGQPLGHLRFALDQTHRDLLQGPARRRQALHDGRA